MRGGATVLLAVADEGPDCPEGADAWTEYRLFFGLGMSDDDTGRVPGGHGHAARARGT